MKFWIIFGFVNVFFFLVTYIVNFKNDPNPFRYFIDKNVKLGKFIAFYVKHSSDPFKINFEYSLFIFACMLLGASGILFNIIGATIGVLTWVVIVYYSVMIYIMRRTPVIKSDIELAGWGIEMAKDKKPLIYSILIASIVLVFSFSYWFTAYLLVQTVAPIQLYFGLGGVLAVGLFKAFSYHYKGFHNRTVFSSIIYIAKNINHSRIFDYLLDKDEAYFESFNHFEKVQLSSTPNVKVICKESYGSLIFKESFFDQTVEHLKSLEKRLADIGYYTASIMSEPPLFAGGSWKSYTTFLYGMKIIDDMQFSILFKNVKAFEKYHSMFHLLSKQGYENILINGLGSEIDDNFDWDLVKKNFHSDKVYSWNDLDYKGDHVKFYGVRYCAPDQYSINKGAEFIKQHHSSPNTMFYMTLNSHYPYISPRKLADNWKDLDVKGTDVDLNEEEDLKHRYKSSIEYELSVMIDHIERQVSEDNIYILFGDHQPPFITDEKWGLDTPIHIICKNKDLLEPYIEKGFVEGLIPDTKSTFKHEAFLSLFMQSMNKVYGKDQNLDLPFFENGIEFK